MVTFSFLSKGLHPPRVVQLVSAQGLKTAKQKDENLQDLYHGEPNKKIQSEPLLACVLYNT